MIFFERRPLGLRADRRARRRGAQREAAVDAKGHIATTALPLEKTS